MPLIETLYIPIMNPIYRKYNQSDAEGLILLMSQLGYNHSKETISNNVCSVREMGGEIFVAEVSGEIHGCVSAIIDVRLAEGKNGEIVSLVVSEESRGQGLGKALTLEAENWLSERVSNIRVRANSLREQAHLFYASLGYKKVKTQAIFVKNI